MRQTKNEQGFTLIELIVVIILLGILGAVVIPKFSSITLRARISADVSSVKMVQNQMEFYYADTGKWPGINESDTGEGAAKKIINELIKAQYLDSKYMVDSDGDAKADMIYLQTDGAKLSYHDTYHRLYLEVNEADYNKLENGSSNKEIWIVKAGEKPKAYISLNGEKKDEIVEPTEPTEPT